MNGECVLQVILSHYLSPGNDLKQVPTYHKNPSDELLKHKLNDKNALLPATADGGVQSRNLIKFLKENFPGQFVVFSTYMVDGTYPDAKPVDTWPQQNRTGKKALQLKRPLVILLHESHAWLALPSYALTSPQTRVEELPYQEKRSISPNDCECDFHKGARLKTMERIIGWLRKVKNSISCRSEIVSKYVGMEIRPALRSSKIMEMEDKLCEYLNENKPSRESAVEYNEDYGGHKLTTRCLGTVKSLTLNRD